MTKIRAVLHIHSTWSYDGSWNLPEIARLYGRFGIRAVMLTEHDTGFDPESFSTYRAACAAASTPRCTLIPGIEYSSPENDIHILTWGLRSFLAEHRPVLETLKAVRAHGGAAVFAHPVRRNSWEKFDPEWADFLSAIELWNRKADGICWGSKAFEIIQKTGLPATVGQDFHRMKQLYPLTQTFEIPEGFSYKDNIEEILVSNLNKGSSKPEAFYTPVLRKDGSPIGFPHRHLEWMRRAIRGIGRHNEWR